MLDERFFLGVGTGERLNEQPFAERWPGVAERRQMLNEAVDLIRASVHMAIESSTGASTSWSIDCN